MAITPARVRVRLGATYRRLLTATSRSRTAMMSRVPAPARRRLGWGIADQAVSSLTNFAMVIYVARTVGAAQFGAFSLAYVTYSFALNASRGLATDPLVVRFTGTSLAVWRRAVRSCSGTAAAVGVATGACVLLATPALHSTVRLAFLGLGLTLPGLLLQDSWRYAFFALGRGGQAFLNDVIWAVALFPALLSLRLTGTANAFWFVFAWGAAAAAAAVAGAVQAKVIPSLPSTRGWLRQQRDLGFRYMVEGTSQTTAIQLRSYGVGFMLGLAAVGYLQAVTTLMGPFMVIFYGMNMFLVPEAARVLRRSPRHLSLFSLVASGALALLALAWGAVLLMALPAGLGAWLLGGLWRPTYALVLPQALYIAGACATTGARAGLHALAAARRSLRAMVLSSVLFLALSLLGAVEGGAIGTVRGAALSAWLGALLWWLELRAALRKRGTAGLETQPRPSDPTTRRPRAAWLRSRRIRRQRPRTSRAGEAGPGHRLA